VLDRGGLPSHDTRRWRSGPHLRTSLDCLEAIVARLAADDVRMYRMSSDLVPYATHPQLPQFHRQVDECGERLAAVGERARRAGIRLSFHPGQYVVLNSEDEQVRRAAARDLELAATVLDALGAGPEAVVVLHVGGGAGGTEAALDRFLTGAELLSPAARARLVVENDDRRFGLRDVLALAQRAGLRVVWDVHHHRCHDPDRIPEREALALALATWEGSGAVPKIHWSSPRTSVEERTRRVGRRVER
jgi:UV DNA damage endonuclease